MNFKENSSMLFVDTVDLNGTSHVGISLNVTVQQFSNRSIFDPDDDTDYDYYNIADRAISHFSQPHFTIALLLGVLGVLANSLTLAALFRVRKNWTPHFRLLVSLMLSDLLIDFTVIFHVINRVTNPMVYPGEGPVGIRLRSRCLYIISRALNTTSLNISLMNLMGMALDNYLGIFKPLHHPFLLGKGRAMVMIMSLWVIAFILGFSNFLSPFGYQKNVNSTYMYDYCEITQSTPYQEEFTTLAVAFICLCLMTFMYIRIYHKVYKRNSERQQLTVNCINTSQRALGTTLLILGSFMICWLPFCLMQVVLLIISKVNPYLLVPPVTNFLMELDRYLYDLVIVNTLCDPIIYVMRIKDVKIGYRLIFTQCCSRWLKRSHILGGSTRRCSRLDKSRTTEFHFHSLKSSVRSHQVDMTGIATKSSSSGTHHELRGPPLLMQNVTMLDSEQVDIRSRLDSN